MNPTRDALDAGLLSHPRGLGGLGTTPPFGAEIVAAGSEVVARLTAGRARSVVLSIPGAADELALRAPWSCWLLEEREFLGTPAPDREGWMASSLEQSGLPDVQRHQIAGLWRLMSRPTPMGDDPTGWSFLVARWLIAPLLPPSGTATVREWTRMFHNGGESRRSARDNARLAVADALECERTAGPELWADLCRSQFVHPVQITAVGNIIRAAIRHAYAA
jgi:hypothetical protein